MTEEEHKLRKKYYSGVRRTKYLLRYMPRRSNIDRYPVLKWFSSHARKRDYLWSFRTNAVTPAFYIGWIVTLLPLVGQSIIGFFLALIFRANLMIVVALQFVSTPVTAVPIWTANYIVGDAIIRVVRSTTYAKQEGDLLDESIADNINIDAVFERTAGATPDKPQTPIPPTPELAAPTEDPATDPLPTELQSTPQQEEAQHYTVVEMVKRVIDSVKQRNTQQLAHVLFYFFTALILGAVINGVILGFISSAIYKYFSKRNQSPLRRLHLLTKQRARAASSQTSSNSNHTPPS